MSEVVIVGGTGFIGTRLSKRLAASDVQFRIVDKEMSELFGPQTTIGDVRSLNDLRLALTPASTIVNLAAEHRDDVRPKSLYDDVNVGGARNLCQIAEEKGIHKIIFTSSVAVYGFAPAETDESGAIRPFNDYGRTKAEAEGIFRAWQAREPRKRSLVVVRPTVVFGEQNRGNVFNLLRQIASGKFVMIGHGRNKKSMAYVENVAAFLQFAMGFGAGIHVFNYIDKPDLDMNSLVATVERELQRKEKGKLRLPYSVGYGVGLLCDAAARVTGRPLPVSSIRVKKFCSTTQFSTATATTGFVPPVTLTEGLQRTVRYEFLEDHSNEKVFFTE